MKNKDNLTEEQEIIYALNTLLANIFGANCLKKYDSKTQLALVAMFTIMANYESINPRQNIINARETLDKAIKQIEDNGLLIELKDGFFKCKNGLPMLMTTEEFQRKYGNIKDIINKVKGH